MKSLLRIYNNVIKGGVFNKSNIARPNNIYQRYSLPLNSFQQIRWKRIVRVNPVQAIKERKAPKPVSENVIISNGNARLVDDTGKNYGILEPKEIIAISKSEKKGIYQVAKDPIVYKLMPIQKKEKQEKLKLKEVRISDVITEHDLQIKVDRIKKFLVNQYKVQVILSFKQTKDADPTVAHLLMSNIISRLSDYSEIDFSERLSKDKKSVCVLNPLPPEKYEAMGIKSEKVAPVKREKKKTLSEEELMEKRRKKEEKKERLRQIWAQNNQSDVFVSAEERYRNLLEEYGETAKSIERKKQLLESGMSFAEIEKHLKKDEIEFLEKLRRKKDIGEEEDEEDDDLESLLRKYYKPLQRPQISIDDYDKYDEDDYDKYDMDEDDMYVPEFDENYIDEDDEHMYR